MSWLTGLAIKVICRRTAVAAARGFWTSSYLTSRESSAYQRRLLTSSSSSLEAPGEEVDWKDAVYRTGDADPFALFQRYRRDDGMVVMQKVANDLKAAGIRMTDPRLKEFLSAFEKAKEEHDGMMHFEELISCTGGNLMLLAKALTGKMIIPDFAEFKKDVRPLFEETKKNISGELFKSIPQLSTVNPDFWGVSICTVDGQRATFGDDKVPFCVQSAGKCLNYPLVLDDKDSEFVHSYVSQEPSGQAFNTMLLNKDGRPHNPMVNAGAIVLCSLMKPELETAAKFDWLQTEYQKLTAGEFVGFDNSTFQSEKQTADRNFALGYFLKEMGAFPKSDKFDLGTTLEFYFQTCSIQVMCTSGSVAAATLANGGVCPLTGQKVLSSGSVRNTLSLMLSCGMNENSGLFAFEVGLPAKSGVSGCILLVVPNVMGVCLYSPRLDTYGNSSRGVEFAKRFVSKFSFHHYDSLLQSQGERYDPRRQRQSTKEHFITSLLFSASEGDLSSVKRLVSRGTDATAVAYDGRSALHLAACGGHIAVVCYLVDECGLDICAQDRWGRTPLDEAKYFRHQHVIDFLTERLQASTT